MNKKHLLFVPLLVLLIFVGIAATNNTPILRGLLQSDMNGNGFNITNVASVGVQNSTAGYVLGDPTGSGMFTPQPSSGGGGTPLVAQAGLVGATNAGVATVGVSNTVVTTSIFATNLTASNLSSGSGPMFFSGGTGGFNFSGPGITSAGSLTISGAASANSVSASHISTADGSGIQNIAGANVTGTVGSATSAISFSGTLGGEIIGTQNNTAIALNPDITNSYQHGGTASNITLVSGQTIPTNTFFSTFAFSGTNGQVLISGPTGCFGPQPGAPNGIGIGWSMSDPEGVQYEITYVFPSHPNTAWLKIPLQKNYTSVTGWLMSGPGWQYGDDNGNLQGAVTGGGETFAPIWEGNTLTLVDADNPSNSWNVSQLFQWDGLSSETYSLNFSVVGTQHSALSIGTRAPNNAFHIYNDTGNFGMAGGLTNFASGTLALLGPVQMPNYSTGLAAFDGSGLISSTTAPTISGANISSMPASAISSGTVATARLGSGTANSMTFLRGDSTWQQLVASLTGDGTIFNNSASQGAVTLTLANASANSVLGNATGSPAAPTYLTTLPAMSGANLTGLTAANMTGTVPAANIQSSFPPVLIAGIATNMIPPFSDYFWQQGVTGQDSLATPPTVRRTSSNTCIVGSELDSSADPWLRYYYKPNNTGASNYVISFTFWSHTSGSATVNLGLSAGQQFSAVTVSKTSTGPSDVETISFTNTVGVNCGSNEACIVVFPNSGSSFEATTPIVTPGVGEGFSFAPLNGPLLRWPVSPAVIRNNAYKLSSGASVQGISPFSTMEFKCKEPNASVEIQEDISVTAIAGACVSIDTNGTTYTNIPLITTLSTIGNKIQVPLPALPGEFLVTVHNAYAQSGAVNPGVNAYVDAIYTTTNGSITFTPNDRPWKIAMLGDSIFGLVPDSSSVFPDSAEAMVATYTGASIVVPQIGSYGLKSDSTNWPSVMDMLAIQNPSDVWINYIENDYQFNLETTNVFGQYLGILVDMIHTVLPISRVHLMNGLLQTVESANGSGATLGNYRTQITNVVSATNRSSFCDIQDVTVIANNATYKNSLHLISAGQAYEAYLMRKDMFFPAHVSSPYGLFDANAFALMLNRPYNFPNGFGSYNGVLSTGNGDDQIIGSTTVTGLTGNQAYTLLVTNSSGGYLAGTLHCQATVTTAATTGTLAVTVTSTNEAGSQTDSLLSAATTPTTTPSTGSAGKISFIPIDLVSSNTTDVTFTTTLVNSVGAATYNLRVWLTRAINQ